MISFGHRLHQARMMAKFSLRELSEAMDKSVSYNALSKYEKGSMMPSGEVLATLCEALHQPSDFFFRTSVERIELKVVHWNFGENFGKIY